MFKQIFELFKSDSLYEQALCECYEMLEIVRKMFNESTYSLRQSDTSEIPITLYLIELIIYKIGLNLDKVCQKSGSKLTV